MSGTIRVIDLPDLGAVTDSSSVVADKTGTGRFSALALKNYFHTGAISEAPTTNSPYGRQNGAWVPVLGTTGGSVTGSLTAQGFYGDFFRLSSSDAYAWSFTVPAPDGNHIQAHAAGWYDIWYAAGGTRAWTSDIGVQMSLDRLGHLFTTGDVSAGGAIHSPQYVLADQAVWNVAGVFGFAPGGVGRKFFFGAQYYWEWNQTDGALNWISNSVPMWNMRASDGLCFNSVAAVGGVGAYQNISDRRVKTGITPTTKGLAEVLQDVQPIVPEAVWDSGMVLTRDGESTLALTESTLTALNVNAIKELNDLITTLTARVATLEGV
jgi:hypothetical protein